MSYLDTALANMDKPYIHQYLLEEINAVALTGSDKQINWAYSLRKDMLKSILSRTAGATDEQYRQAIAALRETFAALTAAKWWIDNRNNLAAALNPLFMATLARNGVVA